MRKKIVVFTLVKSSSTKDRLPLSVLIFGHLLSMLLFLTLAHSQVSGGR